MEDSVKFSKKLMIAGDNSIRDYNIHLKLVEKITGADSFLNEMTKAAEQIFEDVYAFNFTGNVVEHGAIAANRRLLDSVIQEKPAYIILACLLPPNYLLLQKTVIEIKKLGVKTIGIFGDDMSQFDVYEKYWAYLLDYIMILDNPDCEDNFKLIAAKANFTPLATLPETEPAFKEYIYDVSFVGAAAHGRRQAIYELTHHGIHIETFGYGWPNGEVDDHTMQKIITSSKINLNFSKTINGKAQIKGRIFNTCMCGGFLLTEYAPGIEELFEIGKEIECFKNFEEAKNKIAYYLKNEFERQKIAERGLLRVKQYTYRAQFHRFFSRIEANELVENRNVSRPELESGFIQQCQNILSTIALSFFTDKNNRRQAKEVFDVLKEWGVTDYTKKTILIKMLIYYWPGTNVNGILKIERKFHRWLKEKKGEIFVSK